ncbi:MAG TPA: copper-binding protein [Pseudomonas xinjiangensis]|uniref:Copper-binding protein n=2 Tax=root TaxID=1 RepID=A0A7V1BNY9_9GAMM|nr:copper-binding protein [Halopseudomonas xinjiangensis]HEC47650.1 copper-binding protein [Halopseudomonas xinjiangensis]
MRTKLALMITLAMSPAVFADDKKAMEQAQNMPMGNMQMDQSEAAAETAKATGTVRKINREKGTVTIAHGPVPELEWPAMTMGFKATPEQLEKLNEGDEIGFEFTSKGMDSSITSIEKQ